MIYSVDGNIVSIDGNLTERKVKSLTYQFKGDVFPESTHSLGTVSSLTFRSDGPNSITVNFGDGSFYTRNFELDGSSYVAQMSISTTAKGLIPTHTYTDGFIGLRNITFEFESPEKIITTESNYARLYGALPVEVSQFKNISKISHGATISIDTIPDVFPDKLKEYFMSRISTYRRDRIPDELFNTPLESLTLTNSFDLSDNITSNFFKINQFKETLTNLQVSGCLIIEFPESLYECSKLSRLIASGGNNNFIKIPDLGNSFPVINRIQLTSSSLIDKSIPVWDLPNLVNLEFTFTDCILSDIPNSWKTLYSLSSLVISVGSNQRFNELVDALYELCTVNGAITHDESNFGGEYPNRFRNISWGFGTLSFTGEKVAPPGYVQGVSNGTPTTQGQKAFVLQNQYNHTITHGTPL